MGLTAEEIHDVLGVDEYFKAPEKIMELMFDRTEREQIFKKWLALDSDTTHDQFHEYFEEEQAERKSKKQDFTPDAVSNLLFNLTTNGKGGIMTYELICENEFFFADKVNGFLADGYSLYGNTFCYRKNSNEYFCQAMVKED